MKSPLITVALLAVVAIIGVAVWTQAGQDEEAAFLRRHGISATDPQEIIAQLEAHPTKPLPYVASVTSHSLVLADDTTRLEYDLSEVGFYLSFAPYVSFTHPCYNHSLATCQGELVAEEFDVQIVTSDGVVLIDETVTTHANGFAGVWLPHDIEATVTVDMDGRTASSWISTAEDEATCLTDLRL